MPRGGEGARSQGVEGIEHRGRGSRRRCCSRWGAQSLQRCQPLPRLESEHAEGGGVQFGGEAGGLGAGGARQPGEPVKNVLAF